MLARVLAEPGGTYTVGQALAIVADPAVPAEEIDQFLTGIIGGDSTSETFEHEDPSSAEESHELSDNIPDERKEYPPAKDASTPATRKEIPGSEHQPGSTTDASPQRTGASGTHIPDSLKGKDTGDVAATPHAVDLAKKHGINLGKVEASGRGNRVTVNDLITAVEKAGGTLAFGNDKPRIDSVKNFADDSSVNATEHAKDLAREEGVNLLSVRASGRNGRVVLDDVRAWLALNRKPEPAPQQAPGTVTPVPAASTENSVTKIPMSSMRKVIGSRLQESYQQSPHFRVTVEAQLDQLQAFRREVNNNRLDVRLTVNDLVTTAVSRALTKVPELNAQYDPATETITQFEHADISIAVSTEEGLITPIVKNADRLSPSEISAQITDLATRAKAGTLKPEEFQGGTFTISNLGMFGISHFDAIINPPQVAILAVGGATQQFIPDENGNPKVATILSLTLSADHRVADGATSAKFCKELKTLLETPALIFA